MIARAVLRCGAAGSSPRHGPDHLTAVSSLVLVGRAPRVPPGRAAGLGVGAGPRDDAGCFWTAGSALRPASSCGAVAGGRDSDRRDHRGSVAAAAAPLVPRSLPYPSAQSRWCPPRTPACARRGHSPSRNAACSRSRGRAGPLAAAAFGIGMVHGLGGSAGVGVLVIGAAAGRVPGVVACCSSPAGPRHRWPWCPPPLAMRCVEGRIARRVGALIPVIALGSLIFGAWYALDAVRGPVWASESHEPDCF